MKKLSGNIISRFGCVLKTGLIGGVLLAASSMTLAVPSQVPLYLTTSATPLMMLTMSRDEQLFKKAYSDYTDLDGNSTLDVTYNDAFDYSGYFDSRFCYAYNSSVFKAAAVATDINGNGKAHECGSASAGRWSGNFLNWVAMSRMDVLRFVLYGGNRYEDTSSKTVLERAHIPNDLHAWVKVYAGSDIDSYTPYTGTQSFCNASLSASGNPLIRRAAGAWTEWAATALYQCTLANGTDTPIAADDFVVRVEVCDPAATTLRESFCKSYGASSLKPVGLLQEYGEPKDGKTEGAIRFGLLSGSFSNPRSGGILRRNIGKLSNNANVTTPGACTTGDEIDLRYGTFCNQGSGTEGVINAISRLKLTQWSGSVWSDCNTYGIHNRVGGNGELNNPGSGSATDRKCSAWGNPLSEIYAEALRYLTNAGSTSGFSAGTDLSGLPAPSWLDPYRAISSGGNPSCASCSLLVLSSGLSSFDSDEIPSVPRLDRTAAVATKDVGDIEGITNRLYLAGRMVPDQTTLNVGNDVATHEDLCSSQTVSDLALVRGLCPDIPSQEGSYLLAGLAYQARTQDLRTDLTGKIKPVKANTYTVALAENLPKFNIAVPAGVAGGAAGTISFAPLCQANNSGSATAGSSGWRSCYLGSVTIGPKRSIVGSEYVYGRPLETDNSAGSFSLVWEDSQWGNDHDNDVVTMITYCVGAKCELATGSRNGTGTDYNAAYTGYDICWRSDSSVCGADGRPSLNPDEVLVRVENLSAYAGNAMLTGYSVTGSDDDGAKRVALRPGNTNDSLLTASANPRSEWARPHVAKYKVGASSSALLENPLWYAAKYGAFTQSDRSKADTIAAQGQASWDKDSDGIPDAYFKVTDPAKLKQSLNSVFVDVLERGSSAAAIATNSTRLDTETLIFQAKFNSADWSGQILAYQVNPDGTIGDVAWDTNQALPFPTNHSSRDIFTWNETLADGVAFSWDNLSAAQQTALGGGDAVLGQNRLNWLRGSQAMESNFPGGIFRRRNYLMGDIVNSDPAFVGATNFGYTALAVGTPGQDTYTAFKATTAARTQMLYVGANDGMLHALNAKTGAEVFSYVPRGIYDNLASLSSPSYSHRYYVDGAPNFGDVYFDSAWHTVLIGTTGAGGASVFALDVTDPDDFDAGKVLWEVNSTTSGFANMGLTVGYATVGRLKSGDWVAILGNGYSSAGGKASLFIVNVQTGALIKEIPVCNSWGSGSTCNDTDNGLSTPALLVDSQRNVVAAYAGDLKGNLWEFDLSGTSASAYVVANQASGNPAPLYKSGRPITSALEIGVHPSGGYMIYFGTGKYYETGDNVVGTNPPVDRFYGIRDEGDNKKVVTSDLVEQTIIAEQTVTVTNNKGTTTTTDDVPVTYSLRGVSANTINWTSKKGWYLTLTSPVNVAKGERVVSSPRLRLGRVIFPTLIPSAEPCDAGGTSWLMEIDALTGGRLGDAVFDLDGNLLFNSNGDYMPFGSSSIPPSGMQSGEGIIKTPAITSAGEVEYKFAGGSRGGIQTVIEKGDVRAGRQSWRQLR